MTHLPLAMSPTLLMRHSPPPAHPDVRRGHQRTRQPDSGHRHREHHPRAPRHHPRGHRAPCDHRSSTPIASTWSRKDRSSSPVNIINCWQTPVHFRSWSTGDRPEPATTGTERLPPSGSTAASGITSPCRRNVCASSDCACREASCAAPWPPASCPPASATWSSYDVASWLSWIDPYPALCSTLRNQVRTVTEDPKELHYEETVRSRQVEYHHHVRCSGLSARSKDWRRAGSFAPYTPGPRGTDRHGLPGPRLVTGRDVSSASVFDPGGGSCGDGLLFRPSGRDRPGGGSSGPGGPRGLLPWGSHGSVHALSGIRLFIS